MDACGPSSAVRDGDWKLVIDQTRPMLFNLSRDIGERTDVIASHADVARQMRAALEAWQADVEAEAKAGGAGPSR